MNEIIVFPHRNGEFINNNAEQFLALKCPRGTMMGIHGTWETCSDNPVLKG